MVVVWMVWYEIELNEELGGFFLKKKKYKDG